MDLLNRLRSLDRRRHRLDAYFARVNMAFWMPQTQKRLLYRLQHKFRQLSDERARVLAAINADPALRKRLRDRDVPQVAQQQSVSLPQAPDSDPTPFSLFKQRNEEIAAEQQLTRDMAQGRLPSDLPRPIPDALRDQALSIRRLRGIERSAKDAYQDAVWFYKWGDWKSMGITVERVTDLLDRLKHDMQRAALARVATQQPFEDALRQAFGAEHHILYREHLLDLTPQDRARAPLNAFQRWLEDNVPERQQTRSRSQRRGRQRQR